MPRLRATGAAKPYRYLYHDKRTGKKTYRWRIQVELGYDEDGKRLRKSFTGKTSREVAAKAKEYRDAMASNGGVAIDSTVAFGRYAKVFLEEKTRTMSAKGSALYRGMAERYLRGLYPERVSQMRPTFLQRYFDELTLADGGVPSESSRRVIHTCAKQIFALAVNDGVIPRNPMDGVKVRGARRAVTDGTGADDRAFTVDEMTAMLRTALAMPVRDGAIWVWRLLTGMRQGEILGARSADLKLRHTVMRVPHTEMVQVERDALEQLPDGTQRPVKVLVSEQKTILKDMDVTVGEYTVRWQLQQVCRRHGCGKPGQTKGPWPCGERYGAQCPEAVWLISDDEPWERCCGSLLFVRPKSHVNRVVPVIPQLAGLMERYLKAMESVPDPHGLLFRHDGGRPFTRHEDSEGFKELMRESGIDPSRHRGHDTRHSAVTLLASMGVDHQLIREIVGHSSEAMLEHYRHADSGERLKAMEALGSALDLKELDWKRESDGEKDER
ncbi:site-specific integrase [Bifidobacterium tissieri]|uniref:Site-specific integrase n=1 Tax=Bifidobacterium tissieri TaxID=1630162 RepID=A0A5M9ZVS6_9BIFI|nr:site-specific integrase [Bifidobacterium tissieri]KAA8831670.1 site-specific integrase [Bifidobacterium tissieri]